MIIKYFKVILRNLLKHKLISLTNILVLSVVMAIILHLFQYVAFETSFDKFHKNGKNLYRVCTRKTSENQKNEYAIAHGFVGKHLTDNYPEVKGYVNITPLPDDCTVSYENIVFRENKVYQVDSSFFDVFSFRLITGNPKTVLNKTNTVVVSESLAKKYFNKEDPIGKVLKIKGKYGTGIYTVTGIFEDFPENSHIQSNCLVSDIDLYSIPKQYYDFESSMIHWVYILLQEGANIDEVEKKINVEMEELSKNANSLIQYFFQPMKKIHLYSNLEQELREISNGNYKTIFDVLLIGFICLTIAYLNFINTSIVRTIERSKEMGIRKIMGAGFIDNIKFFFTEAIVQIVLAFIGAIIFYLFTLNVVKTYFNFSMENTKILELKWLFGLLLVFIIISILLGLIYALVYSKINPYAILKGNKRIISNKLNTKSIPMLVQFITCILFLSFMLVTIKQRIYINNKDLGFNQKNVIMLLQPHLEKFWEMEGYIKNYEELIAKSPLIKGVSQAVYNPGSKGYQQWGDVSVTKSEKLDPLYMAFNTVRYNFFDLYEMKIIEGKKFDINSNVDEIIVNYSAVKYLGYDNPRDIIGAEIFFYQGNLRKSVIGVIEDFHQESLKKEIIPIIFRLEKDNYRHAIIVRIDPKSKDQAINFLKDKWYNIFPESEFVYDEVETQLEKLYEVENRYQSWLIFYAIASVLISVVGIIVITFYTLKEREKEIAIRKVLGARMLDMLSMSKGFFKILLISLIVGLSISYYISVSWLSNFAYHIKIGGWFVLIPLVLTSVVFLIALVFTIIKAYSANPVDILKYE